MTKSRWPRAAPAPSRAPCRRPPLLDQLTPALLDNRRRSGPTVEPVHRQRFVQLEQCRAPKLFTVLCVQADPLQCDVLRHLHVIPLDVRADDPLLEGGSQPDPIFHHHWRRATAPGDRNLPGDVVALAPGQGHVPGGRSAVPARTTELRPVLVSVSVAGRNKCRK